MVVWKGAHRYYSIRQSRTSRGEIARGDPETGGGDRGGKVYTTDETPHCKLIETVNCTVASFTTMEFNKS